MEQNILEIQSKFDTDRHPIKPLKFLLITKIVFKYVNLVHNIPHQM